MQACIHISVSVTVLTLLYEAVQEDLLAVGDLSEQPDAKLSIRIAKKRKCYGLVRIKHLKYATPFNLISIACGIINTDEGSAWSPR